MTDAGFPHGTGAGFPHSNVADGSATVGVQAQTVHDVTIYQVAPDDPPERKFDVAVRYLDGGMPRQARRLIDDVIVAGLGTSEVWFHWLLALLSDRTLREFSREDLTRLGLVRRRLQPDDDSAWADGVRLVLRLLDALRTPDADFRPVLKELDGLGTVQRDKILRHLDVILRGPIEDQLWQREIQRVRAAGRAGDREQRVWMFFQPKPEKARVRPVAPPAITETDQVWVAAAGIVCGMAAAYLGWLVLLAGDVSAMVAFLASATGGYAWAVHGPQWRFRVARRRMKDQECRPLGPYAHHAPQGGFADQVDRMFDHYFARYVPDGASRSEWLAGTSGIRRTLRDEIVEIYRERRVSAKAIAWLIRYEVSEVKRGWQNGRLLAYRRELRTPATTLLASLGGLGVLSVGACWVIQSAIRERPLGGSVAALLSLVSALVAARGWLRIAVERRRFAADQLESQVRYARREAAYQRWCAKLARKPTDLEMARWLDCDRKILLDWAMRHYQLHASDVIAHAFLETPARNNDKRARVRNGPWRYAKYRIVVFLLTRDGVRQVSADLDFQRAVFANCHRTNYRFDAVAAVHVTDSDGYPRTFELTLVNGERINVRVTESGAEQLQLGEDPDALSRTAKDASGLTDTLHVLEGIAAEGKEWVVHEIQHGNGRINALTTAIHDEPD